MVQHLEVNHDIYALTFATNDNMRFDLIKNCVRHIPNSKKKYFYSNNKDLLYVDREFYQQAIDEGRNFLKTNASESDVYWANVNEILFPCGYYQVAVAIKKNNEDKEISSDIKEYFEKMGNFLQTEIYYSHDYFTKTYCIASKGDNHEKLRLDFNSFILENGTGPFKKIEAVSSYGELEQKNYPIYTKRK